MNKNLFLTLALIFSIAVFSDGHTNAEKMVLENVETYWDARNSKDWGTVVALTSSSGMLGTNSDGSFHKPLNTQSAADWARQNPGSVGQVVVHASEAHQLNASTVYARYYAEGVVPDGDGSVRPYRTRVTSVWVKEDSNWVMKTSHFSSAAYGGTHQTVEGDFED